MYLIIRIIIIVVLLILLNLLVKKVIDISNVRKYRIIMIVLFIFIFYIICLIPFENMIINFKSPNEAFKYMYGNKNIIQVIEDNNYAFIIYGEDGSSVSYTHLQNKDGGWKIHNMLNFGNVIFKNINGYQIDIYNIKNPNRKLIIIREGNLPEAKCDFIISDNKNSTFKNFYSKYKYVNYYTVFYYTIIDSTNKNYQLNINGQSISIN